MPKFVYTPFLAVWHPASPSDIELMLKSSVDEPISGFVRANFGADFRWRLVENAETMGWLARFCGWAYHNDGRPVKPYVWSVVQRHSVKIIEGAKNMRFDAVLRKWVPGLLIVRYEYGDPGYFEEDAAA